MLQESRTGEGLFVGWVRRRPLAGYVVLAYAISWVAWAPVLLGVGGGVAVAIGGFGPAIAAWLVIRWTGGSVRAWLRPLLRWAGR